MKSYSLNIHCRKIVQRTLGCSIRFSRRLSYCLLASEVNMTNTDIRFNTTDEHRHWCPVSEKFASGDALVSALDQGWAVEGVVFREDHWAAGVRRVPIYHIKLV